MAFVQVLLNGSKPQIGQDDGGRWHRLSPPLLNRVANTMREFYDMRVPSRGGLGSRYSTSVNLAQGAPYLACQPVHDW